MTVYVVRGGVLVNRADLIDTLTSRSVFPAPRLSRLEPYASPIDGKEITSWAQRDRDLKDNNAYDPRDLKRSPENARRTPEQLDLFRDTGK